MEKQRTQPQLRFPEFNGDWEKKKIKELAEIKYGKDQKQIVCEDGKYPIMGTGGEIGKTNVFLYDKPSVMIGRKGTIDKPRYMDTPFWTVDTLFYTEVFEDTDPKWLYYKFETINWYLYNEASGVPSLSSSTIYSIPITTPILPEQQKIASFFTAIDQKISQLKRKKTLLEQYKKGVTQKIFSQRIRFKDDNGQEFPKWEKKRLGDISERMTTKNTEGNENVLTISAQHGLVGQLDFFNKSVAANDLSGYYLLKRDDFAYNKSYSAGYPMGAFKRLKLYDKGVVSTLYICFAFKTDVSFPFMEQYYESGKHNKEIEKVAQEGARNHGLLNIGVGDFFDTEILLPSLPEQTKIANFLSAIDDKINHTQKQIDKAEVWKKGLMQQMFI